MLTARRTSVWTSEYEIEVDGSAVTTFRPSWWRSGGTLTLDGREYTIRSNMWGGKYGMAAPDGAQVAAADKVGRKNWTVDAGGHLYRFRRTSMWTGEQALVEGDREVGTIRRLSWWKGGATAELPGLDLAVQAFVLAVVLTMWDQANTAAATAGGAAG